MRRPIPAPTELTPQQTALQLLADAGYMLKVAREQAGKRVLSKQDRLEIYRRLAGVQANCETVKLWVRV